MAPHIISDKHRTSPKKRRQSHVVVIQIGNANHSFRFPLKDIQGFITASGL